MQTLPPANIVGGQIVTYDPSRVTVTWSGITLAGFSVGRLVEVEPVDSGQYGVSWPPWVGGVQRPTRSGSITITLIGGGGGGGK